eukprot:10751666-Alexandrium_andersonii.AAC.1
MLKSKGARLLGELSAREMDVMDIAHLWFHNHCKERGCGCGSIDSLVVDVSQSATYYPWQMNYLPPL